ncbi:glycosyltransferase [Rhodococcus sp. KBS0724]|uniref:polysaccharide pyruvyl transferase family protein n=1 Tax=Rhodococcus sp. KBS0724 TaxID=1179674 RepID=UPI00110F4866|nr:polysaccharide pyruvyl transferase family protein [Rhodococcus sp. KBS0724]TSD48924.1 glycosyltransferase [Rhodococcus sp. KBS0724]
MSIKEFSLTESRPTVGVVIPTIGRESFRRAIESVRCQTFPSDQIVVVLDRPESREQVESILMSNERLIVTTGALGGSACRNIGLEALSQDFVCFLDDDDWWDSSKLEYQVQGILADRSLLCFTGSIFHEEGKADRRLPREPFTGSSVASYLVQRSRLTHGDGYIQTSSLMVETVLAKRIRWDDSLPKHQDWDFIVRLFDEPGVGFSYVPEPLVHVVKDSPGSISKQADWRASLRWFKRHESRLDRRAGGDFVCTHILRSSFAGLSAEGVRNGLSLLYGRLPHMAAVVVGLSGLSVPFGDSLGVRSKSVVDSRPGRKIAVTKSMIEILRTFISFSEVALCEVLLRLFVLGRRVFPVRGSGNVLIAPPGGGNIGDQAMVDSFLQNSLRESLIIVRSRSDFEETTYARESGTESVELPGLLYSSGISFIRAYIRFLSVICRSESVSVIGADIMDGAYNLKASVRRSCVARAGAALTGNSRIIGFSWNGSASRVARFALKRAGAKGVKLFLRDPVSFSRANLDGIPNIRLVSDSVFSLTPGNEPLSRSVDLLTGLAGRPFVLINASGLISRGLSQVDSYVKVLREVESLGYTPVLIPHVVRANGDDLEACRAIAAAAEPSTPILIDSLLSPHEVRHLCEHASFVVTGRMHLGVIALSAAKPAIIIGTQGKVEGLMEFFGIEELLVAPTNNLGTDICGAVRYLVDKRKEVDGVIAESLTRATLLSGENFVGV